MYCVNMCGMGRGMCMRVMCVVCVNVCNLYVCVGCRGTCMYVWYTYMCAVWCFVCIYLVLCMHVYDVCVCDV